MEGQRSLRKADSYESSTRLMWGYVGALVVAVSGKVLGATGENGIWIVASLGVLIWTSFGQGLAASAYNGLVSGLFYNFFFISQDGRLSFDSVGDRWLAAAFVFVGILAGMLGRWVPTVSEPGMDYRFETPLGSAGDELEDRSRKRHRVELSRVVFEE